MPLDELVEAASRSSELYGPYTSPTVRRLPPERADSPTAARPAVQCQAVDAAFPGNRRDVPSGREEV
jgi:hypothetical protein